MIKVEILDFLVIGFLIYGVLSSFWVVYENWGSMLLFLGFLFMYMAKVLQYESLKKQLLKE